MTQELAELYEVIKNRQLKPKEGSYTNYLFEKGLDKILKKSRRRGYRSGCCGQK